MLTLTEELFLLALREKKDSVDLPSSYALPYAVAGGLLLELHLAGKVRLEGKKVTLVDATPTGDPLANDLLESIAASKKVRKIEHWISIYGEKGKKLRKGILESLVSRGVLREEEKKFLWVIPYTGYATQDATARFTLKQLLRAVVLAGAPLDGQILALLSLVRAAQLEDHLFTRDELKLARKRIETLASSEVVGQAVVEAIQAIESAAAVVIIAATSS